MARVLFVINEDWFFRSHFLHVALAAQKRGDDIAIACRYAHHQSEFASNGLTTWPLPVERRAIAPATFARARTSLRQAIAHLKPDLIHAIGVQSILLSAISAPRSLPRIHSLTGLGRLASGQFATTRQLILAHILRICDSPQVHWLFENSDDLNLLAITAPRAHHVMGAGVAADAYRVAPLPPNPPLRLGLVARLIHQKGADIAVAAVKRLREQGIDLRLTLAGQADAGDPRSFSPEVLRQWQADGVVCCGHVADINGFWAEQHIALIPSRHREGLPRAMVEAAACGRPIIASDISGNRDLLNGTGACLWVRPDDPAALADAIAELAHSPERLGIMGQLARQRFETSATADRIAAQMLATHDAALGRRHD